MADETGSANLPLIDYFTLSRFYRKTKNKR